MDDPENDTRYLKEDARDDDEYESDEDEELNNADRSMEDAEAEDDDQEGEEDEEGPRYRRITANEDALETLGKRRKLDRSALGFEFAPRLATSVPSAPLAAASSRLPARNSPPDWSEHSSFVLLDAWGDLYLQNGRKSLRSDEWKEVSKKVNHASKTVRSEAQCRNRLDTLKKKYKKEKARMAESANSSSKWVYFKKLEMLMSSPLPPAAAPQQPRLPCGVDSGEYVFTNSSVYLNRSSGFDEMRDSPGDTESINDGDEEEDESDGLPPERVRPKGNPESSSFRILADSIQKFGEIYEKIENTKKQQMAELERMRREFHRDLEVQKRQILEQAQAEIAKLRQAEGEGEEEDDEEQEEEGEEEEDNDDGDDPNDVSADNVSG